MIRMIMLALFAAVAVAAWKLMEIILLVCLVAFAAGCNGVTESCYYDAYGDHYCSHTYHFFSDPTPTQVIVVEEEKPAEETIILIETIEDHTDGRDMGVYQWDNYCGDLAYYTAPYDHHPWYCHYYDHGKTECDWYMHGGCYETWRWDDWNCEWVYMFNYCQ